MKNKKKKKKTKNSNQKTSTQIKNIEKDDECTNTKKSKHNKGRTRQIKRETKIRDNYMCCYVNILKRIKEHILISINIQKKEHENIKRENTNMFSIKKTNVK